MTWYQAATRLALFDSWGNVLISSLKYQKATYDLAVNKPTNITAIIFGYISPKNLQDSNILAIFDKQIDSSSLEEREQLDGESVFLVDGRKHYEDDKGNAWTEIYGTRANCLVSFRDVGYVDGMTAERFRNVAAESVLKGYANTNLVTISQPFPASSGTYTQPVIDLGPGRAITALSIAADLGQGPAIPYITGAFRDMQNLFDEICLSADTAGTPVFWDIVVSTDVKHFVFNTYIGQRGIDRTGAGFGKVALFSNKKGNLSKPEHEVSYRGTVNYIWGGGKGTGRFKQLSILYDASRINIGQFSRREKYLSIPKYDIAADLTSELQTALRSGRPKDTYTAVAVSIPGCVYGIDWKLGDKVPCQYKTNVFDETFIARIDMVNIVLDEHGKTATAALRNIV